MRRILTTTTESHPDVPEPLRGEGAFTGPLVWQIYIDGAPFLGVPVVTGHSERAQACAHADQILATGRYEYVDVRLRPDRRLSQRRTHDGLVPRVQPDRRAA